MNTYDVYLYLNGRTEVIKVEAPTALEAKAIAEARLGIAKNGFDADKHVFAVSEQKNSNLRQK